MSVAQDSRLLHPALSALGLAASAVVAGLWAIDVWDASRAGNGLQLCGLVIAVLQIPKTPRFLGALEAAATRFGRGVREAGRQVWLVIRGRHEPPETRATIVPRHTYVTRVRAIYDGMDAYQRATRALDEIGWLRDDVLKLEARVDGVEAATDRKLAGLRGEFHEHVLSISEAGWTWVYVGGVVTAAGILMAMFG